MPQRAAVVVLGRAAAGAGVEAANARYRRHVRHRHAGHDRFHQLGPGATPRTGLHVEELPHGVARRASRQRRHGADAFEVRTVAGRALILRGQLLAAVERARRHVGRPRHARVARLGAQVVVRDLDDLAGGDRHLPVAAPRSARCTTSGSDVRKSAEPRKAEHQHHDRDREGHDRGGDQGAAAEFFGVDRSGRRGSGLVESKTVPKTRIQGGMYLRLEGKETRADRHAHHRDARERRAHRGAARPALRASSPTCRSGSIKKGEALVTTGGNGKTVQCGVCHGADLKGLGPVPGIAGRSPSYMVRQMSTCRPARATASGPI